jgi:hypothetical protein
MVEDALDAIEHPFGAEVEEEADAKIRQAEVGKNLLAVNRGDSIQRLQFHYDAVLHEQVDTETVLECDPVVHEVDSALSIDMEAAPMEGACEKYFVHALEQPRSDVLMDLDRGSHDGTRYLVDLHLAVPHSLPFSVPSV